MSLGFGGAEGALLRSAKSHNVPMTAQEATDNVYFYRKVKYPVIVRLWHRLMGLAVDAIATGEPKTYATPFVSLTFDTVNIKGIKYFRVKLPSGRYIWYPDPKLVRGKFDSINISYVGIFDHVWRRGSLWYGTLIENIVQATARDILCCGLLSAEKGGYKTLMSIHDEAITEMLLRMVKDESELCRLLCPTISWAKGLPLKAAGDVDFRFKKD